VFLQSLSKIPLIGKAQSLDGHHFLTDKAHIAQFQNYSQTPGIIVSFNQHRIVSGDFFLGYHGWDKINRQILVVF